MEKSTRPDKQADNRDNKGKFKPGQSGNPNGRPKGKTLKEYAREFLINKTDKEKIAFLNSLSKETVWRMAEGNPPQDLNVAGLPEPVVNINIINDKAKKAQERVKKKQDDKR